METRPVVLVTGASGFIGRHLVTMLEREGWDVRCAVRTVSGLGNEVVVGSIDAVTDWNTALQGVDAVIHLAARVHYRRDESAAEIYRQVNVEGTLRLASSAAKAGVGHFIFISTVLLHGRSNQGRPPFRETDVSTPRGLYGKSKAAAEAGLKEIASETSMVVTVIRPPLVYGAGAKGNFALLERAVASGLPLPFAAIKNRRAFVSVDNLVSFILHRLVHPDGKFEIFLVADSEQVSTTEFIDCMARAAGKSPRLFRLPTPLLGVLLSAIGRSEARYGLLESLELDLSKVAATGWRPPTGLADGLQRAWRERGA
jgi:UDP-glucose 4-epimerase